MTDERKRILITGASSGIGATTVRILAEHGFFVYAGVRRDIDGTHLEAMLGPNVRAIHLEVTDSHSIDAARELIESEGGLDAVINNAGIVVAAPLEFVSLADVRRQFEVNTFGPIALTQAMLPLLRRSRGRLINVGSIAGRAVLPFMAPYAASKHALRAFSDALRMEIAPAGVTVSLIEPGAIATPIWRRSEEANSALNNALPQVARDLYGKSLTRFRKLAHGAAFRASTPEKVAHAILHALEAKQPHAYYLVGTDAFGHLAFSWLPARVRDFLLRRVLADTTS
jgi:NAD(P)-dependent dehydrogenase (short-subunit alcohol dehydrogenase family)